jgi:hypothetical protein
MKRWRWICGVMMTTWAIGAITVVAVGNGPALDPSEVSGAAPDPCFDCKDFRCAECPKPAPCKELNGYCEETIRNLSQFCAPRTNGQWDRCKFRFDQSAACVVRMMNPCTREHPVCSTQVDKCGPNGVCIPEGLCIP